MRASAMAMRAAWLCSGDSYCLDRAFAM
jgi:hypothetical protein